MIEMTRDNIRIDPDLEVDTLKSGLMPTPSSVRKRRAEMTLGSICTLSTVPCITQYSWNITLTQTQGSQGRIPMAPPKLREPL